jgi:hypothetical protein
MRLYQPASALVATLATVSVGETQPSYEVPFIAANGHVEYNSTMTVKCDPARRIESGQVAAWCNTVFTAVTEPSKERTREDLAAFDQTVKTARSKDYYGKLVKDCAVDFIDPKRGLPVERELTARYEKACRDHAPAAMISVFRDNLSEVQSKTCHLETHVMGHQFERIDANTWRSAETLDPPCRITMVLTLSRAKERDPWSFQQVRSVPPNATGPLSDVCAAAATSPVMVFGPGGHLRELGCKYFDF